MIVQNHVAASLETATLDNEKTYYSGLDNARVPISGVAGYPQNDNTTSPRAGASISSLGL